MIRLLLALALLLPASPAAAQVTLSGSVTLSGNITAGVGVDPPAGGECDLPLSFADNQGVNCMRTIYKAGVWDRRSGVSYGHDPSEPKLTTDCPPATGCGNLPDATDTNAFADGTHSAMVLRGNVPPNTQWVVAYNPDGVGANLYGDGTTCVEVNENEVNGEGCAGVAVLITEGANQTSGACGASDGGAYTFTACEGKNTDEAYLDRVNLCTGARTNLVTTSLAGLWDVYGGAIPPANSDHNRGQPDWHQYAQWVQVCLTTVQVGANITFSGTAHRIGKASGWVKADPENNDPGPPSGTLSHTRYLMGTTTHGPIARAANINATGQIGVAGAGKTQSGTVLEAGVTNLRRP